MDPDQCISDDSAVLLVQHETEELEEGESEHINYGQGKSCWSSGCAYPSPLAAYL